jgi:hypothetical protein
VIASSSKGAKLIPPRSDRDGATSQGEDTGGFAWPRMRFVSVDGCKASHHGCRLATMTLILLPLILNLPR